MQNEEGDDEDDYNNDHNNYRSFYNKKNNEEELDDSFISSDSRFNELYKAIRNGDLEEVKTLFSNGPPPRFRDHTPLTLAIHERRLHIARFILEQGAKPLRESYKDYSVFEYAVIMGLTDFVKLFVEFGVDPQATIGYQVVPFVIAAEHGQTDVVLYFLSLGASPNVRNLNEESPLFAACSHGHVDIVEILLNHDANPNIVVPSSGTPLTVACQKVLIDVIDRLLAHHSTNVNLPDRDGKTALMHACETGNFSVIDRLLIHGADPNQADSRGFTALMYAANEGEEDLAKRYSSLMEWAVHYQKKDDVPVKQNIAIVDRLISLGADVNAINVAGYSALMIACRNKIHDVAERLLVCGAKADLKQGSSNTPLLFSFQRGDAVTVELLLSHGADFDPSVKGRYFLAACEASCTKIAEVMVRHGADVNFRDARGTTPLMIACRNQKHDLVRTLLDHGADIDALDNNGRCVTSFSLDDLTLSLLAERKQKHDD